MPAIYIARSTGYVDDPDCNTTERERYRLDEFGDPFTIVDVVSTLIDRHLDAARADLDPLDLVISRGATLTSALRAYRYYVEGVAEGTWRDSITDAYAFRSEIAVWSEPTPEELSA